MRLSFAYKIVLAMIAAVVVAVGTVAIVMNRSVGQHFDTYLSMGARRRIELLTPALESYYADNGSWLGVEASWEEMIGQGRGQGSSDGGDIVLADADGDMVYDPAGECRVCSFSSSALRSASPLVVDGETVGYLVVSSGQRGQVFKADISQSLVWAAALAGLVAILMGLLLTRAVVRPIRIFDAAAQRIAAGDLTSRVPIASRDEIGALAHRFNEMAASLERDEQLRQKMMADIAHELRTPLSVVRGQVEALQDGVFELTQENLAPIHQQTILLGRLIEDLRDLALAEAGRLPLEIVDLDLGRLVQRAAEAFRSQALAKGVELVIQVDDRGLVVSGDQQRLEQVLANLLSNALRHTPDGGRVTVRPWAEADAVGFEVADTGAGIPADELDHIFDRFYRVARARNRADGGSGLGLSIAKQLAEAHGGEITVQSVVGAGSTFRVALPPAQSAG